MFRSLIALQLALIYGVSGASAAEKPGKSKSQASPSAQTTPEAGAESIERLEVEKVQQKYWAQGEKTEMGVVQNRLYSKGGKLDFGVMGSTITTDPFLSVRSVGGHLGYHLNETFSVHAVGWKSFASASSALETFRTKTGATTNYNNPKWYGGGEVNVSLIYGKISLIGEKILYFDLHFGAGFGMTGTESGNFSTPSITLAQRIFLSRTLALRIDYKLMRYNEMLRERVIPTKIGQDLGYRTNWSNVISVGLDFLIGGDAK